MEAFLLYKNESGSYSNNLSTLESLSFQSRARRYPRLRILVEPLFWTELQLPLLRCAFIGPLPASTASMELSYPGDSRRQTKFEHYFRSGAKDIAIRCLIGGSEVPLDLLYVNLRRPCYAFPNILKI